MVLLTWASISIVLAEFAGLVGIGALAFVAIGGITRRRKDDRKARTEYKKTIAANLAEPMTLHPEIDPAVCAGCGACVQACPEGDIIQLINHRAVLISPTKCVGHGQCERACPVGAISLVFGTKTRGMDLPRLTTNFETNVSGLYIAGELGGMGLIRNAVKQGRLAAEHACQNLPRGVKADVDVLVVGAGPAGLSASLAAIAARRSFLCIEQNSVGGTVYNFPRQKVVMSQPADLPIVGAMKFPQNKVTKEELLAYWSGVRRKTGLKVKENCKFIGLSCEQQTFLVETTKGTIRARKVILAMGVRGTPRRLNLPNEDLPKVTYNLLEPEQYQRRHIAVVGGGNAAVEAAQYLANPTYRNKVSLLVRGDVMERCNEENQNIIKSMARQGLVKICFRSSVNEIHKDHLVVEQSGQMVKIPNHYLFIFIGAEVPFKFLQSLGVKIDKKFGEALQKA